MDGTVVEELFRHVALSGVLASAVVTPPSVPKGTTVNLVSFVVAPNRQGILDDATVGSFAVRIAHRLPMEEIGRADVLTDKGRCGRKDTDHRQLI